MFNNKRGLSTVVTTLIIILLVLVAIGIIWTVINGVIESGSQSADFAVKCLAVDVRATDIACASNVNCNVTLNRRAGGEPIDGIKLYFYNSSNNDVSGGVIEVTGNIEALATVTKSAINPNMTSVPNKVDITPYFVDTEGNDQLCATKQYID